MRAWPPQREEETNTLRLIMKTECVHAGFRVHADHSGARGGKRNWPV
jgi:hypothetical protein